MARLLLSIRCAEEAVSKERRCRENWPSQAQLCSAILEPVLCGVLPAKMATNPNDILLEFMHVKNDGRSEDSFV